MKQSGIYIIENLVNGKKYVGQSVNISSRRNTHMYKLRHNTHDNEHLQQAFNKYGEESFKHYIIEHCNPEDLDAREQYYILKFKSYDDKFGYNMDTGGGANRNIRQEVKEKQRKVHLGTNSKLTVKQVEEIKTLLSLQWSCAELSKKYNVTISTISKIAKGKNWSWVLPELNDKLDNRQQVKRETQIKVMELMRKQGYSDRRIAKELKCNRKLAGEVLGKHSDILKDRNNKIVADFKKGMSKQEIMNKYNISSCVYVSVTKEAFNEKVRNEKEKAIKLRNQGYKVGEIAKILGKHRTTITEWTIHANTEVSQETKKS